MLSDDARRLAQDAGAVEGAKRESPELGAVGWVEKHEVVGPVEPAALQHSQDIAPMDPGGRAQGGHVLADRPDRGRIPVYEVRRGCSA